MCSPLAAAAALGLGAILAGGPGAPTPTATAAAAVSFPGIRIVPTERRIEVEAAFALSGEGYFLEYLAVAPHGKLHESLFTISCAPEKLQLGLILCGLEPKAEVQYHGEARELTGPRVAIEVEWKDEAGAAKRARVEDLLHDVRFGRPMERTGFAFTGSRFLKAYAPRRPPRDAPAGPPAPPEEIFAATSSGSAIALYHDPDAVLDFPLLSGGDVPILAPTFGLVEVAGFVPGDERFKPISGLPRAGTPATLHLRPAP